MSAAAPRRAALLRDVVVVAVLAALPVVVETFAGFVRGGFDLGWFFHPLWEWWFARPRLGAGWNPWLFGGWPSDADPQLAVLHPFTFLYAVLPGVAASAVEGALVPAFAATGMILYLAGLGCGRTARLAGALSFALGGYLTAHAPHPGIERAAMMVPWGLLAIDRLEGRRLVAGLGAVVGLVLLAGHPQVSALAILLLLLDAAWLGRPWTGGRWRLLAAGFALGTLIGAPTWLPAIPLVRTATRSLGGPIFPDPRLAASDLPSLLAPLAGGGGVGPLGGPVANPFACGVVECTAHPGLVAWIAVVAGCGLLLRDARGRFWIAVALFALGAASGVVPLPSGVRGAARILLWWNVAFAVLAALALDALLARADRVRGLAGAGAAVGLLALALAWRSGRAGAIVSALLAIALAALALHALRRGGRAERWLVGALAADLLVVATTLAPAAIRPAALAQVRAPAERLRALLDAPGCDVPPGARVLLLAGFEGIDVLQVARVATVQGYNPLVPQSVALLLGQTGAGLEAVGRVDDVTLADRASRALDVLRVAIVVRDDSVPSALGDAIARAAAAGDGRWESWPACGAPGLQVFRNGRALPVAWLVDEALPAPRDAAIARLRGADGGVDPRRVALLEEPDAVPDARPNPVADSVGTVTVAAADDDTLVLRVTTARDALLVTSEAVAPGWRALVDGTETSILVANGGFRALRVAAGTHEVRFVYRPWLSRVALLLGVAGALAALLLARGAGRQSQGPRLRSNASTGDSPGALSTP